MKTFCIVLVVIVAAAINKSSAVNPEEVKAKMMPIFMDCKTKSGASDDDIAKLMMHSKPATHEGLCMFACVTNAMGVIQDNKLSKEGLEAWEKSMGVSVALADKAMAACGSVTGGDECETAANIGLCFKKIAVENGITM